MCFLFDSFSFLGTIKDDMNLLCQLLDTISGYSFELCQQNSSEITNSSGYLLLIRYNGMCEDMLLWKGPTVHMEHNAENAIILSHVEVSFLEYFSGHLFS